MQNYFLAYFLLTSCLLADTEKQAHYPDVYQEKDFSFLLKTSHFPKKLLEMHFKLYKKYLQNAQKIWEKLSKMSKEEKVDVLTYGALKRRWNVESCGIQLHEYYFAQLGGQGKILPHSPLMDAIKEQFQSYVLWKKDFIRTGMMRGIGWAVLCYEQQTGKLLNIWIDEHNIGSLVGVTPLLVMDVWEHAYITEFGLQRQKYISTFFADLNWSIIENRFNDID